MRGMVLMVICWLALSGALIGKTFLNLGGSGPASILSDTTGSDNGTIMFDGNRTAPVETRSDLDLGMDKVTPQQRVDLVEFVLLNGALAERPRGDPDADDTVTLWVVSKPFNTMVSFKRSWFPAAAPGVTGPFCGQRVNYEIALFNGNAPLSARQSTAYPVPFELTCDRAAKSRNARTFEEFSARAFLVGQWAFEFRCQDENYEVTTEFLKGLSYAPSFIGQVSRLAVDRIEEPSYKFQMDARRDRDTGEITIVWGEDDRGLHRSNRQFVFKSPSVPTNAMSMGGDVSVSREGSASQLCGRWLAKKLGS